MRIEIEITRNHVTPAQFLSYVRREIDKKGYHEYRSDLELDYFASGNDLNFVSCHKRNNDSLYRDFGVELEVNVSKPFEMQTYIKDKSSIYNEICEFSHWDDKTGTGYYYLLSDFPD